MPRRETASYGQSAETGRRHNYNGNNGKDTCNNNSKNDDGFRVAIQVLDEIWNFILAMSAKTAMKFSAAVSRNGRRR